MGPFFFWAEEVAYRHQIGVHNEYGVCWPTNGSFRSSLFRPPEKDPYSPNIWFSILGLLKIINPFSGHSVAGGVPKFQLA